MNTHNDAQLNTEVLSDEQLTVLLDAKEAGKSFPDALSALHVDVSSALTKDAKEFWDMHSSLMHGSSVIHPSRELLSRIVQAGGEVSPVAHNEHMVKTGFSALLHALFARDWKVIGPVLVLVIMLVAVFDNGTKDESGHVALITPAGTESALPTSDTAEPMAMARMAVGEAPTSNAESAPNAKRAPMAVNTMMMAKTVATPPSGNVDDLVALLGVAADSDLASLSDPKTDHSLITSDTADISGLTTTYDETTF